MASWLSTVIAGSSPCCWEPQAHRKAPSDEFAGLLVPKVILGWMREGVAFDGSPPPLFLP